MLNFPFQIENGEYLRLCLGYFRKDEFEILSPRKVMMWIPSISLAIVKFSVKSANCAIELLFGKFEFANKWKITRYTTDSFLRPLYYDALSSGCVDMDWEEKAFERIG